MGPTVRLKNSFWFTAKRSVTPVQMKDTVAPSGRARSIQSALADAHAGEEAPAPARFRPRSPNQTLCDIAARKRSVAAGSTSA